MSISRLVAAGPSYVVVLSQPTWSDPSWQAVATTLATRHAGRILTYAGSSFPDSLRVAIATNTPDYVCFVAQAQEVTRDFVAGAHQMLRQLDADPYGDAVWGIITGLTASEAQALADRTGPLTVDNALMKTGGDWLNYLYSGVFHAEGDTGMLWTRSNGGNVNERTDGPVDDTVPLVDGLNANTVDLMVTSGHASEYNWQLHYPTPAPEGYFMADGGQLYGFDYDGVRHDINTMNDKIYYAPGNCLIAHIPEDETRGDSMALAWLKTGGAAQMAGYVVTTAYGYMGWGVADYFIKLQDRWTFAESCFLNNQALIFDDRHDTAGIDPVALSHDRDVFVLYGDPAYVARLQSVTQPDYSQSLQQESAGGGVTNFTLTIQMNRAVNVARPVIARLPFRLGSTIVTDNAGRTVEVTDDLVLVNLWQAGEPDLQAGQAWTIRFSTACSVSLSPGGTNIAAGAFSGVFSVNTGAGCGWVAGTSAAWIHPQGSGNGQGTVSFTVEANPTASERSGAISVGDQIFVVTQVGDAAAAFYADFESYTVNQWPGSLWDKAANAVSDPSRNRVETSPGGDGGNTLRLYGVVGQMWAALAFAPCSFPTNFYLECRVYNGTESIPSTGQQKRAVIRMWEGITLYPSASRGLLYFRKDGQVMIHEEGMSLGTYATGQWYQVKIHYQRAGTNLSLTYWFDGVQRGRTNMVVADLQAEQSLDHLNLECGAGSAWFDDIKIYAAAPPVSTPGWRYIAQDPAGLRCQTHGSTVKTSPSLVQQFAISSAELHALTGDVDGDGRLEIVTTSGSTMRIHSGSGSLKRSVTLPRTSFASLLEDVDGDGVLDIGLGGSGSGFAAYFYKGDGTLLKTLVGQHAGGSDVSISPIGVTGGKVLIGYDAGYARTPRGMAAFDYATATETWYYQLGLAHGVYSVADWGGDGSVDIIKAAGTVHNGASGNGTTDGDMYLVMVDETGSNKITQVYPSPSDGLALHVFADLTGDGKPEILGFEGHDPTYYRGTSQIHLYGLGGVTNELATFEGPNNTSWTYAVGDLDGDGSPEVVATAIESQTTYVLDASLSKRKEKAVSGNVQLVCDLNGDGSKEIVLLSNAGMLRVLDRDLNEIASAQVGAVQWGEVIASDIDDDGIVELLARTDKLYVLEFIVPVLNRVVSGNNLVLSWPTNWGAITLEYCTNLSSGGWLPYPVSPMVINQENLVIDPMSDRARFYRLRK